VEEKLRLHYLPLRIQKFCERRGELQVDGVKHPIVLSPAKAEKNIVFLCTPEIVYQENTRRKYGRSPLREIEEGKKKNNRGGQREYHAAKSEN